MTFLSKMELLSSEIKEVFKLMFLQCSVEYYYIDGVIIVGGNHHLKIINKEEFLKLRSKALKKFSFFSEIIEVLLVNEPSSIKESQNDNREFILDILERDHPIFYETTVDEVYSRCSNDLDKMINCLKSIYSSSSNPVVIPDTSTLLNYPDLEKWEFNEFSKFTIAIVPNTLSEIDAKKDYHKNATIQSNAKKLVNKLKAYRARATSDGFITLVKNKIDLRFYAFEPNFRQGFKTLDPQVPDDRFVSSVVEVIRDNLESEVFAISDDINLVNKLYAYQLPTTELK